MPCPPRPAPPTHMYSNGRLWVKQTRSIIYIFFVEYVQSNSMQHIDCYTDRDLPLVPICYIFGFMLFLFLSSKNKSELIAAFKVDGRPLWIKYRARFVRCAHVPRPLSRCPLVLQGYHALHYWPFFGGGRPWLAVWESAYGSALGYPHSAARDNLLRGTPWREY